MLKIIIIHSLVHFIGCEPNPFNSYLHFFRTPSAPVACATTISTDIPETSFSFFELSAKVRLKQGEEQVC